MNIAIRYYSKFGHSKKIADVIAQVAGVNAETVSVPLDGETDMLFLGAGVFLGKVDKIVLAFMDSLSPSDVKCVVLFGSSAIVDSPVPQMRKRLEQRDNRRNNERAGNLVRISQPSFCPPEGSR